MNCNNIISSRLRELGCTKLPAGVFSLISRRFEETANAQLTRLAKREITIPKIAKIFSDALTGKTAKHDKGEFEGESATVPLDQQLLEEGGHYAD